jgi:hypothetical protein
MVFLLKKVKRENMQESRLNHYFNSLKKLFNKAYVSSLVIAFILWGLIKFSETYQENFLFKLEIGNIPNTHLIEGNQAPKDLVLTVKASGFRILLLKFFTFKKQEFEFDQLECHDGVCNWSVRKNVLKLFPKILNNIAIVGYSKEQIRFDITEKVAHKIPIEVKFSEEFTKKGYKVDSLTITPKYLIVLEHPDSVLKHQKIFTKEVSLTDFQENIKLEIPLDIQNKGFVLNTVNPVVKLNIFLDRYVEKDLLVTIHNPSEQKLQLFPTQTTLKISVPSKMFKQVNSSDFRVNLLLPSSKKWGESLPLEISSAPLETTVLHIEPKDVEYLIIEDEN